MRRNAARQARQLRAAILKQVLFYSIGIMECNMVVWNVVEWMVWQGHIENGNGLTYCGGIV